MDGPPFYPLTSGGHYKCLHLLATVNVLLRIFVCKFLWEHMLSFLLELYLGWGLLGHVVNLCLIVCGPASCTGRYKVSNPSTSLPALVLAWLFYSSHLRGCEVITHCGSFPAFLYWSFDASLGFACLLLLSPLIDTCSVCCLFTFLEVSLRNGSF